MVPIPAVRQKRSKELSTSCQAVSRLGTSATDEGVVIVVMALLSFAAFDTPSLTASSGPNMRVTETRLGKQKRIGPDH